MEVVQIINKNSFFLDQFKKLQNKFPSPRLGLCSRGVELPTSRYTSGDKAGPVNLPSVIEHFTAYFSFFSQVSVI